MSAPTVRRTVQLTTRGIVTLTAAMLALVGVALRLLGSGHVLGAAGFAVLALAPLSLLAYYSEEREVER